MIFRIAQYTNLSVEQNSWVVELSDELKSFFNAKNYGRDLNELYFGLITVKPEFEQFFKKKRPRYSPGEKNSTVDGIKIKSTNCAEIDVKIDYSEISNLKKDELIKLTCFRILSEIDCLTRLSKLKDFNYLLFKSEFEGYLSSKSYLME